MLALQFERNEVAAPTGRTYIFAKASPHTVEILDGI
jgi:hypothetical protein